MGDEIRAKETVEAASAVPVVPGGRDPELAEAAHKVGRPRPPQAVWPALVAARACRLMIRDLTLLDDEIAAARREGPRLLRRRHPPGRALGRPPPAHRDPGPGRRPRQRRPPRRTRVLPAAPAPEGRRGGPERALDEASARRWARRRSRRPRSCGYAGAGTVEFIVPGNDPSSYYFMEMNTRLQVEHPVTELVTGLDLVEWQLRVAAGERLPFAQEDITLTGHAIEARICAEDPARGFLLSGGTVLKLHEPSGGGIRTDSGLSEGTEVGSLYDPMLSKVIAYGPDRATALRKLRAALADTVTLGVPTNAGFLRRLLAHPDVVAGELDTGLVEREADSLISDEVPEEVYEAAAAVRLDALRPKGEGWTDPFSVPSGWRLGGAPKPAGFQLRVTEPVEYVPRGTHTVTADQVAVTLDGVRHTFRRAGDWLGRNGDAWQVRDHDPVAASLSGADRSGAGSLTAPMPGTVTVVKVAVGDQVTAGQSLLVVEAMKMEHVVSAPHAGTVAELDVTPGTTVAMDQVLAVVTP
ncbi:biotin/lipoyl-containing protein [Streptomyces sp. L7]